MCMVPYDYKRYINTVKLSIEKGDVPLQRIDDAVRRILTVKLKAGLFERHHPDFRHLPLVGSSEHRQLARRAVAKSLVLLKNKKQTLPLRKSTPTILVAGQAADDVGLQCGGWTIEWLGKPGRITPGVTILEGIRFTLQGACDLRYDPQGVFEQSASQHAAVGIIVLAELPYAEGYGDRADLSLPAAEVQLVERLRTLCDKLILILLSGRPLIVTEILPMVDALVAAWLPGTEGQGVADVLFGVMPFTGRLSYDWPRSMEQVPMLEEEVPLFSYGYGLTTR
jgi:beta-glucosidase